MSSDDSDFNEGNKFVDSEEEFNNENKNNNNNDDNEFLIESNEDNNQDINKKEKEKEKVDNKKQIKDSITEIKKEKEKKEEKEKKNEKRNEEKIEKEEKREEKMRRKKNIYIKPENLNRGNEIIINKQKDVIIVELDKGKSNYNNYDVYQLSLLNDNKNNYNSNKEIKILCYRRYKDFYIFYQTLKRRFPECIFPRLSQRNFIKTKILEDPVFIENRRKELQFFINKLYFHDKIGKSEEFANFLYKATFDDEYYKSLQKKHIYPVCKKILKEQGYINKGWEKVKDIFIRSAELKRSEMEQKIFNGEKEYSKKLNKYSNLLKEIKVLSDTADEETRIYKDISNNLMYLKDDNSISFSKSDNELNKNKFNTLININEKFADILKDNNIKILAELVDPLNYCILYIEGIMRAYKRYNKFFSKCKQIHAIYETTKDKDVLEEIEKIKSDKKEFEETLCDEIQKYDKENIYEKIIDKILLYIKNINEREDKAFQDNNFK